MIKSSCAIGPLGLNNWLSVFEYPLDRVADITGVDAELIAKAARMYATEGPACIPWTPITDQQVSSTSAIRSQCMLRAISGNLDIKGGDQFVGFANCRECGENK